MRRKGTQIILNSFDFHFTMFFIHVVRVDSESCFWEFTASLVAIKEVNAPLDQAGVNSVNSQMGLRDKYDFDTFLTRPK